MATLNINGKRVKVDDSFLKLSPEQQNATVEEIAAQIGAQPVEESAESQDMRSEMSGLSNKLGGASIESLAKVRYDALPEWKKPLVAAADMVDLAANGATMGFGNKAAAAGRALFTDKTYAEELEAMKLATQRARDRSGYAGTAAEFAGSIATPTALAKRGVTLAGRFGSAAAKGAKGIAARSALLAAEGSGYGGITAAGNDTDIGSGMLVGGVTAGALPIITGVGGAVARPFVNAVRARMNPAGYAAEKVSERVGNKMSVEQAGRRMEAGEGLNLADVSGESARGLLRTAANLPGKARDRIQAQVTLRQFGQGDRLKSAIQRTFADPEGYLATKDQIAEAMEKAAGPLYRVAYSKPLHYSETLEAILATPAGKKALQHATELAKNEQVPFKQFFVQFTDDGGRVVRRVPDTRGWDYIKKSLDDMIDAQTDTITKKVTNEGRILIGLKNRMLEEVDRLNPDYAVARSVWSGKKSLDDALELGRKVFELSPAALKKEFANLGPAQRLSARVGAAEKLRHEIDQTGFTQNAVLRIFSRRNQMRNLQTMFETPAKFKEFRKAIFDEARKRATYGAATGNSTTIRQGIDMAEAGGLQEGVDAAKSLATGGAVNGTLNFIGSRLKMLGGMTPEVADEVSKRLMASTPAGRRQVVGELSRISQLQVSAEKKRQALTAFLSRALAISAPMGLPAE